MSNDFVQISITISDGTPDEMAEVARDIEARAARLAKSRGMRCQATIDQEEEFPRKARS